MTEVPEQLRKSSIHNCGTSMENGDLQRAHQTLITERTARTVTDLRQMVN
ncbi:MAG: hypothetical protein ACLSHW_06560 [Lachnospiraceae bacterium]